MFIKASSQNVANLEKFASELSHAISIRDGKKVNSLLFNCNLGKPDLLAATPQLLSKLSVLKWPQYDFVSDYILFLRSRAVAHNQIAALEMLVTFIKKLTLSYSLETNDWLHPLFTHMLSFIRKFAYQLDKDSGGDKWRKKLVEVFRELFPSLHKERSRLSGTCWLICQLLSLYISLDQVKLCAHILAALSQSLAKEGGFQPLSVPKSVAVTLYFYWGKYHVLEGKHSEAKVKLMWALQHCPKEISQSNRRRIAEYLIPCIIASGSVPKPSLMEESSTSHFIGLANAIRQGDIQAYNSLVNEHMLTLARSGTLILVEKCKLICYRNLAKRVYCIMKQFNPADPAKLDLSVMEVAWKLGENATKDEMICALADLIYAGAMKGYIALEHGKLVLSKINPFPRIEDALC